MFMRTVLVTLTSLAHLVSSLRVAAAFSVIEHNPLLVASQDYYKDAQVVNGGVADLFGGSSIDLAGNAETQALRQYANHTNLRIIYTVVEVAYRLVASKKAGINSLADLKGKKIGTIPSTSAAYFVQKYLATAGLKETDYTTVSGGSCNSAPCGSGTLPYMLSHGTVDAVGMWEPTLELAIEGLGSDAVVFQNKSVYREVYNLYTTAEKLKDTATRKSIVAYIKALKHVAAIFDCTPDKVIPRVARTMNMSESVVKTVWPIHDWKGGLASDLLDVLVPEDQWVAKVDRRSAIAKDELSSMIDSSVLAEATLNLTST
jgi:ABC-type nitrate/sulfonate/bicarbonate transport system substrate-binding protein